MSSPADLARARRLVRDAGRVVALTGAGVSAESGVPTFRAADGLWRDRRPKDLATPQAFARDPRTAWAWYDWRRSVLAGCVPNPGHRALARFFLGRGAVGLVTQNVDGLHTRAALEEAGESSADAAFPVELHGTLERDRCSLCAARFPAEPLTDSVPLCTSCGGMRRPDVVLFGEALDGDALGRAHALAERADLCLAVGTSAAVHPAAAVPLVTLNAGGALVEVNLEDTPLTRSATVALRGSAGETLPALLD